MEKMRDFDYKKSLGQNFLKDQNIINKISDSINPSKEDLIIEIGPGAGALTKKIVKNLQIVDIGPIAIATEHEEKHCHKEAMYQQCR